MAFWHLELKSCGAPEPEPTLLLVAMLWHEQRWHWDDRCLLFLTCLAVHAVIGRKFLTKINANIGNSAVSSSIEEVRGEAG